MDGEALGMRKGRRRGGASDWIAGGCCVVEW